MRLVIVKIQPQFSKGKYKGGSSGIDSDGLLRIATNLLDVPAEIIALLYAYRRTIEIFFHQFKHLLGCRHLLSHNQNGIEIQTYCAIVVCLVIALWTGRKPTKRTHEMLCFQMLGWAMTDEMEAHLAKLKVADEQAAQNLNDTPRSIATPAIRAALRCAPRDSPPPSRQAGRSPTHRPRDHANTVTHQSATATIFTQNSPSAEQCCA